MSIIHCNNVSMHLSGNLPQINDKAPDFSLVTSELKMVTRHDFLDQPVIMYIFPSIDTKVCFDAVKLFNQSSHCQAAILCISMDLPFALKRIVEGEQLHRIILLSDFRYRMVGERYGLMIVDGPLRGLLASAVIVLNKQHDIEYVECLSDICQLPAYLQ